MRRIVIAVTIVALLVVPQFALAGDLDDFKAANDKLLQAYRSLDAEAIASMIYPGAVGFDYGAAFPSIAPMENTQTQLAAGLKMLFGYLEVLSISPYNTQYRVVGNTGISWGHATINIKVKGESMQTRHQRGTSTWIKSKGKWYVLISHGSAIPPSN